GPWGTGTISAIGESQPTGQGSKFRLSPCHTGNRIRSCCRLPGHFGDAQRSLACARQVAGGWAMILKAKERGDAPQLARYLLSMRDNEHVELHDVRGFVSDDLHGAFSEADAIAQGTRCKNYLFSMSLNPPAGEKARTEDFELAIDRIEKKLGLESQPRAIVFHEKD